VRSLISGILLLAFVSSANASIVDNGIHTTDTNTGLDWLDLTETIGMSYNQVTNQFDVGGRFEGYQYATGAQVNTLISNYTGIATFGTGLNYFFETPIGIDGLVQLLGNTYITNTTNDPDLINFSFGITGDTQATGNYFAAIILDRVEAGVGFNDFSRTQDSVFQSDAQRSTLGSFLVRTASVPESSSLMFLIFGLLGLFGVARRKA